MVVVIAAAFLPALTNAWVSWDDDQNFVLNKNFRNLGWPGLRWAWTTFRLGVYQPLGWMLFETEYAFGGLDPAVYHGVSLGLHIANSMLLYVLVKALIACCSPAIS